MLKISKMTDYALQILSAFQSPARLMRARELSEISGVPLPTVNKILKMLVKQGILESRRGAGGGYRLLVGLGGITVGGVVRALEGPVSLVACSADGPFGCVAESYCTTHANWRNINDAVREALDSVTLEELAPNTCVERPARTKARTSREKAIHP